MRWQSERKEEKSTICGFTVMRAASIAGNTIFRYELSDYIHLYNYVYYRY